MTSSKAFDEFWKGVKSTLIIAGVFSLFINLMLLGPVLYMLQVYDRVLASRSEPTLYMLSIAVAIALLATAAVDNARSRLMLQAARRIDDLLGERVVRHLIQQSSAVNQTASLFSLKDVAILRNFFGGSNVVALFDAPWLVLFIILIYFFHPLMGAVALVGSIILLLLAWVNERSNRTDLERTQGEIQHSTRFMDQGIRNSDVLNSMGMVARFSGRWQARNAAALDQMRITNHRMGTILSLSKLVRQAMQSVMMGLGAYLVIHDNLSPGIMIAATVLLGRAQAPVESLIGNWNGLVAARAAYQRLEKRFSELFSETEKQKLPPPQGAIQCERVVLVGRPTDTPILRQVDLSLQAGKSLAILGPSGSGKSSLLKLLVGVWAPSAGHVRIDGADLAQWDREDLGQFIGYLPQDVELFPGSIADNIARFTKGDPEAIIAAAQAAHAYELILRLPQGFDTVLGQGGIQLSAGQAQRIGLARAMYGNPRIVVLDEPNANLDAEGEQALIVTMNELRNRNITLVLVTHKPSLVGAMDYLMVMREGRAEIMGPRAEVLAKLGAQPMPATIPAAGAPA